MKGFLWSKSKKSSSSSKSGSSSHRKHSTSSSSHRNSSSSSLAGSQSSATGALSSLLHNSSSNNNSATAPSSSGSNRPHHGSSRHSVKSTGHLPLDPVRRQSSLNAKDALHTADSHHIYSSDGHARSTRSILLSHANLGHSTSARTDSESIVSGETTAATISIASVDDPTAAHTSEDPRAATITPVTSLNPTSMARNNSIASQTVLSPPPPPVHAAAPEAAPQRRDTLSRTLVHLNDENYDATTFKVGWVNRSHGQVMAPVQAQLPNSPSTQQLRERKMSHRESVLFGADMLAQLNSMENGTGSNEPASRIDAPNHRASVIADFQTLVPDYRIYRAELRGCLLNLYKSGLSSNIKYFDPTLPAPAPEENTKGSFPDDESTLRTTADSTDASSQRRSMLPNTRYTLAETSPTASRGENHQHSGEHVDPKTVVASSISYLSEVYPHPSLKLNKEGRIIGGDVESLCHAVLFSHTSPGKHEPTVGKRQRSVVNLVLLLPLVDNFLKFLVTFNQYGLALTKNKTKLTSTAPQYYNISKEMDDQVTERLALVVKTILDILPGFLLEDKILHATISLLNTISLHNDEISNNLKVSVANKHNELTSLTSFIRGPSSSAGQGPTHTKNAAIDGLLDFNKFLDMDPDTISNEVHSINLKFDKTWTPREDYSLLYSSKFINQDILALNPLVFNNSANLHFLGRLLVCHLFPSDPASITPKTRAKLLRKWVQLGCKFEHLGDMVSWLAIATVICSVPILRLFKSWEYVSESTLKIIFKDWVPTIAQLERRQTSSKSTSSVFILAPPNLNDEFIRANVISYFGDLIIHADDLPQDIKFKYLEKKINRTKNAFHKWQQRLETANSTASNSKHKKNHEVFAEVDPKNSTIYKFWRYHVSQPALNIEQIMSLSLKYEPPVIDPKLYSEMKTVRSPLLTGSYLPILFNELLPNYTLFPKSSLIGAAGPSSSQYPSAPARSSARLSTIGKSPSLIDLRKNADQGDTNQITGVGKIDGPIIKEFAQRQSTQQILMKSIRDVFNIDADLFHISDDLVLKSSIEDNVKSRPASVVLESPRKFSQQSFGNNTSRDSRDISHLSKSLENMDFFDGIGDSSDTFKESVINVVLKSASLERIFDLLVLTANIFSKLVDTKDLESFYRHKDRVSHRSTNSKTNSIGLLDFAFIKLALDNDVFTETFFNSYKSFTTTLNVLENLAKRYVGAKSCATTIAAMVDSDKDAKDYKEHHNFPNWNLQSDPENEVNYTYMVKIQIGAAEAIHHLVTNHYSDFTDDSKCISTFFDILKVMEQNVMQEWPRRLKDMESNDNYSETQQLVEKLTHVYEAIKSTFQKELYRPVGINRSQRKITEILGAFKTLNYEDLQSLLNSKHLDDSLLLSFQELQYTEYEKILDWIQQLNNIIAEKSKLITKQDWVVVYQILELESSKSLTSFYNYPLNVLSTTLVNSSATHLKELDILNIFSWLSTLMVKNEVTNGQSRILDMLPNSIQVLIKLHLSLTSFFEIEIANSKINPETRSNRCAVLLQILNYVRWKNSSLDMFESVDVDDSRSTSSHVPSFIETAISNAIVSPESRYFEHSWTVAHSMLSQDDLVRDPLKSITDVLTDINEKHLKSFIECDNVFDSSSSALTPCPGWVISRLLEISQFVPNMCISNTRLINFDKRRFMNNIISNISVLVPSKVTDIPNKHGYILMNEFKDSKKHFRKISKDVAESEARATKYQERGVFNEILIAEVEKIKRDQLKVDSLRTQEHEAKQASKIQQDISRQKTRSTLADAGVAHNRMSLSSNSSGSKANRNSTANVSHRASVATANTNGANAGVGKKLGGFFRRPFSIAGFNTSMSNYSLNSSLSPEAASKKVIEPYLLPQLSERLINDSKPTLSIKTFDIKNIVEIINHRNIPAFSYSFKIIMQDGHEYTIQATSLEDTHDWIKMIKSSKRYSFHSKKFKGKTSNKVFGVPLEDICAREGTAIPTIIIKLLEEIELRGLDEVGLYRIPGSVGSINALKNAFDEEGAVNNTFTLEDDRWFEINAIAGCFKMYLRELPDSLFSNEKVNDFTDLALKYRASAISADVYRSGMITLLRLLPVCYYQTMRRIVLHLNKVHLHVSNNRMDASNLAIVFSMSFIDQEDLSNSMGPTLGAVQAILQDFIKAPSDFFVDGV
ncbi:GTPase-activating protein [Maudiozyma humilis]|uniref:GTPase-activating protein n=1 Tax=Maudiozyma humilis TaxID=51915 RepID=A0AAV5RZ66_MAUHU|nr:GTPase-activating protein [Kazachstania humilis]